MTPSANPLGTLLKTTTASLHRRVERSAHRRPGLGHQYQQRDGYPDHPMRHPGGLHCGLDRGSEKLGQPHDGNEGQ